MPRVRLLRNRLIESAKLVNLAALKAGGLDALAEITGYKFNSLVAARNKNLVSRKLESSLLSFLNSSQLQVDSHVL